MNLYNTKNPKYPIKSYLFVCPSVITYFKGIVGISQSSEAFTSSFVMCLFDLLLIEKFIYWGGFFIDWQIVDFTEIFAKMSKSFTWVEKFPRNNCPCLASIATPISCPACPRPGRPWPCRPRSWPWWSGPWWGSRPTRWTLAAETWSPLKAGSWTNVLLVWVAGVFIPKWYKGRWWRNT